MFSLLKMEFHLVRDEHYFLYIELFALQLEACAHPFFDELREPNVRLPNGRPFPPLFNFKQEVSSWFLISLIVDINVNQYYMLAQHAPHLHLDFENIYLTRCLDKVSGWIMLVITGGENCMYILSNFSKLDGYPRQYKNLYVQPCSQNQSIFLYIYIKKWPRHSLYRINFSFSSFICLIILFTFSFDGASLYLLQLAGASPELIGKLIPEHVRRQSGLVSWVLELQNNTWLSFLSCKRIKQTKGRVPTPQKSESLVYLPDKKPKLRLPTNGFMQMSSVCCIKVQWLNYSVSYPGESRILLNQALYHLILIYLVSVYRGYRACCTM